MTALESHPVLLSIPEWVELRDELAAFDEQQAQVRAKLEAAQVRNAELAAEYRERLAPLGTSMKVPFEDVSGLQNQCIGAALQRRELTGTRRTKILAQSRPLIERAWLETLPNLAKLISKTQVGKLSGLTDEVTGWRMLLTECRKADRKSRGVVTDYGELPYVSGTVLLNIAQGVDPFAEARTIADWRELQPPEPDPDAWIPEIVNADELPLTG